MADAWVGHKGLGPWANRNIAFTHPRFPGVAVRHCRHATANYPWFTYSQDGELRTFRLLAEAKEYVEREYASEVVLMKAEGET